MSKLKRALTMPEANIVMFAFLLNFVWEFLQVPFFQLMPELGHWQGIKICSTAAVVDAMIVLFGYWTVSALAHTRRWFFKPSISEMALYIAIGVGTSIAIELLSLATSRWAYADAMPIIPLLDVGLVPVLQWIILPPLVLWFVRRQLNARR